jgi:outer membrane immunogenic protein
MKKIALALAALTVATPAFAQDVTPSFSGPYVGVIAGYDKLDINTTGVKNPTGLAYGVDLGYDYQAGNVVFGIEGEAAESTGNIKSGNVEIATAGRDLYVGGRVGFIVSNTLLYTKVGYTNARVDTTAGSDNGDGIRFGGGAEYRLTPNVSLKAEYRYSNYEADVERHQLVAGAAFRF